jgi:hypothetical protein
VSSGRSTIHDNRSEKILKWALIVSAALIGLIADHFWPGWGRPTMLSLAIFGCLVVFGRSYWGSRFWLVFVALLLLHLGLMLRLRGTLNEIPMPGVFIVAVIEIIVIAVILEFAFSGKDSAVL